MSLSPDGKHSTAIAFAGGGTGGHLYPALAVAGALRELLPDPRIVFFGTQRKIDEQILGGLDCELVRQELYPIRRAPWTWPVTWNSYRRSRSICRSHFDRHRPVVVVGTGGFASVPPMIEARHQGIPTVILNPDAVPGRANRFLASSAEAVFVQWAESGDHFPRNCRTVPEGCPVRPGFGDADRAAGISRFGLDSDRKTLLVTGASQGSRSVNEAVLASLDFLGSRLDWQILHLTGAADYARVLETYQRREVGAKVIAYTEHMADALAAADVVISRAGASTLAEITALGRPCVLMPYPFHRDQHQLANARVLERKGAAYIVHDAVDPVVNGPALIAALGPLMSDDSFRAKASEAAKAIGCVDAASRIASEIIEIARRAETLARHETLEAVG